MLLTVVGSSVSLSVTSDDDVAESVSRVRRLRVHTSADVLRPITTSSNANAAKAAEILTYLFIIVPFHGCLVSGPAEDGEGGLWATPGLRTPVAPTGLGHQGPALERVPHRLTQSRRFVRFSVNAGWPPPFGSNTTNGVSPAAPALAKILSIARYLPRDPIGL